MTYDGLSHTGQCAANLAENHGWRVHPCRSKIAILERWPERATSDIGSIEKFWEQNPTATVGVATGSDSGLVVVDVDDEEAFGEWMHKNGYALPDTPTATTPSGGRHLYFEHPGWRVRNSVRFVPGCDARGDRGYVIAPDGDSRRWVPHLSIDDLEPPPLPNWIAEPLKEKTRTAAPSIGEVISEGARNSTLASLAGTMRRRGMSQSEIKAALIEANRSRCKPPLPDEEVEKVAISIAKYDPDPHPLPPINNPSFQFPLSDAGNAERYVNRYRDETRYCSDWRQWLIWNGDRWQRDRTGLAVARAVPVVRDIYLEAANAPDSARENIGKHAIRSENRARLEALVALASVSQRIQVLPEELDADAWLLNARNGTIDLRTGEIRRHDRRDLITKSAPVSFDPAAESELWDNVLATTLPDAEVRRCFQKAVGVSLVGDVVEQVLFFLYGTGANGKSTILNAIQDVLGDYAITTAPDLLISSRQRDVTAIADLKGVRFAATIETEDGRRFAEALLKQLTGGDTIRARHLYQDYFEFHPSHSFFLAGNHKPRIRNADEAIWRRILLIPFTVQIPAEKQDPFLGRKLKAEGSAIFRWMLDGLAAWQADGSLKPYPEAVRAAVSEYRVAEDIIGAFIGDCFEVESSNTHQIPNSVITDIWSTWCSENGEKQWPMNILSRKLQDRGFQPYRSGSSRGFRGLVPARSDGCDEGDADVRNLPPRAATQENHAKSVVNDRSVTTGRNPESDDEMLEIEPPW